MLLVKDILTFLDNKFPIEYASSFDKGKIGLQFGNPTASVKKVLVTLDVTSDVIDEAIKNDVNLIVSHHPFMFSPLLNLNYTSVLGRNLKKIFTNDLNIIAMHTNFDISKGGLNDTLIKKMGFVSNEEENYEFIPDHFVRTFNCNNITARELISIISEKLSINVVRTVGNLDKRIKKTGMVAGGGAGDMYSAQRLGVDCYISGEFRHNNALDAIENNLVLIELPHAVEDVALTEIITLLQSEFSEVEIKKSAHIADPFNYYID